MIVTFYSYKGGVGRSMAMANLAQWLWMQDLRVVVVDWDLEAPGLESYFEKDANRLEQLRETRGLMDLLVGYREAHSILLPVTHNVLEEATAEAALEPQPSKQQKVDSLRDALPSLGLCLVPVRGSTRADKQGTAPGVWLLSAGARAGERFAQYARNVHGFDWSSFYANHDGAAFFQWLREELNAYADIVLIDSRTGVTEMSGVCTREMADLVLAMCAPNDSNLFGVVRMARWFLDPKLPGLRDNRPLRTLIVPARVDRTTEKNELEAFRQRFFSEVGSLRALDARVDPEESWNLQIGYYGYFTFHELIIVGSEGSEHPLEQDFRRLAECVACLLIDTERGLLGRAVGSRLRELIESSGIGADERAEAAFRVLPLSSHRRALSLLARLVQVNVSGDELTLTPVRWQVESLSEDAQSAYAGLVSTGLITPTKGATGVEFAQLSSPHYATAWRHFRKHMEEDRVFVFWLQQLNVLRHARLLPDAGQALTGSALQIARQFSKSRFEDLTRDELEFISLNSALTETAEGVQRELRAAAQKGRRAISVWVSLTAAAVGVVAAVSVFIFKATRPGPNAQFSCNAYEGEAPLRVTCFDESANAERIAWNFGDGSTMVAEGQVTHTYSPERETQFAVVLTAFGDSKDETSTVLRQIIVRVKPALAKPFVASLTGVNDGLVERTTKSCPFSLTNDEHTSTFGMNTRQRTARCEADPGFRIVSASHEETSVTRASSTRIEVTPDRNVAQLLTLLTSGPKLDRYRGWLRGQIVLEQEPMDPKEATIALAEELRVSRYGRYPIPTSARIDSLKAIELRWTELNSSAKGALRLSPPDATVSAPGLGVRLFVAELDNQLYLEVQPP